MRQEYKKQNSPRMQNAITKVLTSNVGSWCMDARYIGMWIMELAYGADKYDVLNGLCPGAQTSIVTFARGDIRHRKRIDLAELLAMIVVAIVAVILMLSPE